MPLDNETSAKVIAHINNKWRNKACILCGENQWTLDGYVSLILHDDPNRPVLGGRSHQCIAVVCKNCGNTVLVNAVLAEIVP